MNSKGLFSALILLFFILLTLKTAMLQTEFSNKSKDTLKILFEIEKSSFIRSEIETNFDFLISHSIFSAGLISTDPEFLKENTNEQVASFIEKTKKIHQKKIDFFLFNKNGLEKNDFSKNQLKELFNIYVIAEKNFYIAEFSFNGSIRRNIFFGAQIDLENFSQNFFITPGYVRKVVGISAGVENVFN